MFPIAEKETG